MAKSRLGKGLSALIPTQELFPGKDEPVTELEIELIKPNSFQPRTVFNEEKLAELADSIKEHGVVQPVVVRPLAAGEYELVVGERRLRACQKLGMKKIPAVIKEFSNQQMIEIGLVENIQRQDLNPVEEAKAYYRLINEFKLTQEEVALRVGKSRSFVANLVRLLNLPADILDMLAQGKLSIGQARPLLSLPAEAEQLRLAQVLLEKNMTAREAERVVQELTETRSSPRRKKRNGTKVSPAILDLEERLRSICRTKVKIRHARDKGRIEIEYYSNDDLDRIVALFTGEDIS